VIITAVLRKCVGYFSSSNSYHFSTDSNISGVGGRIGISGSRSLSHSVVGIWFELVMVENPRFAVGISTLSIVKVKERIVLREIHLSTTGRHLSVGSHSVICHPTVVTAPPLPQPGRLVLDLSTL